LDIEQVRTAVLATIASIAPDADANGIRHDQPLRRQVDLDSTDWLNLIAALGERLSIGIPESDYGRLDSVDSIVAYLSSRHGLPPCEPKHAATPVAPAPASALHAIDGTPVTVRPIVRDDAALVADFVRKLSAEARYKRFMATVSELSPSKLAALTDVDQVRNVAMAATVDDGQRPEIVGVARYSVDAGGTACEFAVAVADTWQGTGLAGILMHTLIDIARTRGLATMEGIVLATNRRMLKLARQLGFRQLREPGDPGTVRVVRALKA
jgi:acetyltransferase